MKPLACVAGTLIWFLGVGAAQDSNRKPPEPIVLHVGALRLHPTGFVDLIGMSRSQTTADTVSTHFGNFPLEDTPAESVFSARHSRLMAKGDFPWKKVNFSGYLESDFMDPVVGQNPYRLRQYWGSARLGHWELLGGQAWSLLRPNRAGTASDRDLMNTEVIDPAYHVGLLGSRLRQVRLTRSFHSKALALSWESDGKYVAKYEQDLHRLHWEVAGFQGRSSRRGVAASATAALTSRVRAVTQQYWSHHAVSQALGVVPDRVNGVASLGGIEVRPTPNSQFYSYAGVVSAARSTGNHIVSQFSVGANYNLPHIYPSGRVLFSLQYSHLGREMWNGHSGTMDFLMYRLRYSFNY